MSVREGERREKGRVRAKSEERRAREGGVRHNWPSGTLAFSSSLSPSPYKNKANKLN